MLRGINAVVMKAVAADRNNVLLASHNGYQKKKPYHTGTCPQQA